MLKICSKTILQTRPSTEWLGNQPLSKRQLRWLSYVLRKPLDYLSFPRTISLDRFSKDREEEEENEQH